MTLNNIRNFAIAFVLSLSLAFVAPQAAAQTALPTTTLTANIGRGQLTIPVASVTNIQVFGNAGVAQGGIGSPLSYQNSNLLVDKESMIVVAINTGALTVTVRRGVGQSAQAHPSGAVVTIGPSVAFRTQPYDPAGQCQRTLLPYVPFINVTTGHTFDCLGVTTAGQWFQTNGDEAVTGLAGTTVASNTSITPTGKFFVVSGTTAVATIVVPAGATAGYQIFINPSGIFATTTAGNIGLVTSATVVGRILIMTWDGSKWWPSYVS